jgi:quinol monooxygenase YgiN
MNKNSMIAVAIVLIGILAGAGYYAMHSNTGPIYTVTVIGTLSKTDIAEAKQIGDAIVNGAKVNAMKMGDTSHSVFLGVANQQQFLAIDTWNNFDNMQKFFADPQFAAAIGQLFSAPPATNVYVQKTDWASWGSFRDLQGGGNKFVVTVQGKLKISDPVQAKPVHDQIAEGGRATAQSLGDTTHIVYLSLQDPSQFMAIDVWTNADGMQQFFSDPNVQKAFGSLFDGPPVVNIWKTTDWAQY